MIDSSNKRINRQRNLSSLEALPGGEQFRLMQFSPRLDKPPLSPWKRPGDQFYRIDAEDRYIILIIRVKVRQVVRRADFHVHPDDDPKEPA